MANDTRHKEHSAGPSSCRDSDCRFSFNAMASDCELLIRGANQVVSEQLIAVALAEVRRIESKYSRFQSNSELSRINRHAGEPVSIDMETFGLLNFAADCYRLSCGLFDVTIAPLQRLWGFGLHQQWLPEPEAIMAALSHVGFHRINYDDRVLVMPADMTLDFGGIAKEYAADRALLLMNRFALSVGEAEISLLVNLGGDIAASPAYWNIGIESISDDSIPVETLSFNGGGIATSGDTKRFIIQNGRRVGHILSPRTGYPVEGAPRSVTVVAPSASAAGLISTLAMLKGRGAEDFLKNEQLRYVIQR